MFDLQAKLRFSYFKAQVKHAKRSIEEGKESIYSMASILSVARKTVRRALRRDQGHPLK